MGAFFGAVHLRTEDREPVRELLESMAHKKKTHFYLAPVLRGWLTVYPQHSGQDERISRALAKHLTCDVLHALVHDDDIFCYFLYRTGRLVDQFNSCPDYFGDHVSDRQRKKLKGNPARLAHLLPNPADLPKLEELLATPESEQPAFAQETLERFAGLLELPNALTSYEYLWQGETDGIESWSEFLHVPASEIARQEAVQQGIEAEKQRHIDEGLLLFRQAGTGKNIHATMPHVCAAEKGAAFWVCWASGMTAGDRPLERYRPPWSSTPESLGIQLPATVYYLCPSQSGRFLAVGHASGNWKAQLWDVPERRLLVEHAHSSAVQWADISANETAFLSRSGDEAIRTFLNDPSNPRTYAVPGHGRYAALHPSGDFLVVDMQLHLGILDLRSGALHSPICVGQRQDYTRMYEALGQQVRAKIAGMDFEAIAKQMEKIWRASGLDEAAIREKMRAQSEGVLKHLAEVGTPGWVARINQVQGSERPFAMQFSPSGRYLFCATSAGCRVYEWSEIWESVGHGNQQMPAPVFAPSLGPSSRTTHEGEVHSQGYVYALALDARAERLLFGGLTGSIAYLDLGSGLSGTLAELPGRPVISGLVLSADGTALACSVQPGFFERGVHRRPPELQIWNYQALADALPHV